MKTIKTFETIEDIINDAFFKKCLKNNIEEIRKNRNSRPTPPEGFYYKRDWYDVLNGSGNFTYDYFLDNIPLIWAKKSSITSKTRVPIEAICNKSVHDALMMYNN
jgi:hypothetical protein